MGNEIQDLQEMCSRLTLCLQRIRGYLDEFFRENPELESRWRKVKYAANLADRTLRGSDAIQTEEDN